MVKEETIAMAIAFLTVLISIVGGIVVYLITRNKSYSLAGAITAFITIFFIIILLTNEEEIN